MDGPVSRRCLTAWLGVALCALCSAGVVQAQPLKDPTRPPASMLPGAPAKTDATGPATPQLQSILIARHPGGRNVAVIDGVMLRPGDRYKGALLERMSDTEVVLVQGANRQVLKLLPPAAPRPAQP